MIKWTLIFVLLAAGFVEAFAGEKFPIRYAAAKDGSEIFQVYNTTNKWVYCEITDASGYGHDFEIGPKKKSGWLYVPQTKWSIYCR